MNVITSSVCDLSFLLTGFGVLVVVGAVEYADISRKPDFKILIQHLLQMFKLCNNAISKIIYMVTHQIISKAYIDIFSTAPEVKRTTNLCIIQVSQGSL